MGELRKEDWEFKATLSYRVSSRQKRKGSWGEGRAIAWWQCTWPGVGKALGSNTGTYKALLLYQVTMRLSLLGEKVHVS